MELHEEIWSAALARLKTSLDGDVYSRWIAVISPVSLRDGVLAVAVDNEMLKMWVENNYLPYILDAARIDSAERVSAIEITVDSSRTPAAQEAPEPEPAAARGRPGAGPSRTSRFGNGINPNYTFADFIIGPSNSFAHAASAAVASNPGNAYNPLFIYGDTGLGKTHLLHAIGHYVTSYYEQLRVKYVSTEELTNDFINAISSNRTAEFRSSYRDVDVLLVDDIQFLESKIQTQEEFFHTFNTLHNAQKQIVMTSDRPPKLLEALEPRLRSRFEWGLMTDIQPPDLETRIAILRKKVASQRLTAGTQVLELIASRIPTNIRELEGALTRVAALASLNQQEITVALAEQVLNDLMPDDAAPVDAQTIMDAAAKYFSISLEDLTGSSRVATIASARQIAMYLCRELTDMSLPKIGHRFGGRDHSTVLHAVRKINEKIGQDRDLFNQVTELTNQIKQS